MIWTIVVATMAVTTGWSVLVQSAKADMATDRRAMPYPPVEVCEAFLWDVPIEQTSQVGPTVLRRAATDTTVRHGTYRSNFSRTNARD